MKRIKNLSNKKKIILRIGIGFVCLIFIGEIVHLKDTKIKISNQKRQQILIDEYKHSEEKTLRTIAEETYKPIIKRYFDNYDIELNEVKVENQEEHNYNCNIQYRMKDKKIEGNYNYYNLKILIVTNDSNEIINYKATKSSLTEDVVDKGYIQWNDINQETDLGKTYSMEELIPKILKDSQIKKSSK